ncbi:hypothetical protein M0R72_17590 [Candidatus Pacearchaeota archaeon]|jgi:hypothetical protein|nr:hypothetical protein [Candidatus Pacearchaeota archaeon]
MTSEEARSALIQRTLKERVKRDLGDAIAELRLAEIRLSRERRQGIEAKLRRVLARVDDMAGAGTSVPQNEIAKPASASPREAA